MENKKNRLDFYWKPAIYDQGSFCYLLWRTRVGTSPVQWWETWETHVDALPCISDLQPHHLHFKEDLCQEDWEESASTEHHCRKPQQCFQYLSDHHSPLSTHHCMCCPFHVRNNISIKLKIFLKISRTIEANRDESSDVRSNAIKSLINQACAETIFQLYSFITNPALRS